jgi:uncharacterized RDD family membrane protein YckC
MVTPPSNSYAPPKSVVADIPDSGDEAQKASRGSRLGASIIDGLIFGVPFGPSYAMAVPAVLSHARAVGPGKTAPYSIWVGMAGTGGWFYFGILVGLCTLTLTALFVHRNGQTIGKKLLGIKVVRADGSRATLARIFWLRYVVNTLLTLVPIAGALYGLVDVLMIFGNALRCCHDYIADTIVIRA